MNNQCPDCGAGISHVRELRNWYVCGASVEMDGQRFISTEKCSKKKFRSQLKSATKELDRLQAKLNQGLMLERFIKDTENLKAYTESARLDAKLELLDELQTDLMGFSYAVQIIKNKADKLRGEL